MNRIECFLQDENGQGVLAYELLLALIAGAVEVCISMTGGRSVLQMTGAGGSFTRNG